MCRTQQPLRRTFICLSSPLGPWPHAHDQRDILEYNHTPSCMLLLKNIYKTQVLPLTCLAFCDAHLLPVFYSWRISASEALRHAWLSDPVLHHHLHEKVEASHSKSVAHHNLTRGDQTKGQVEFVPLRVEILLHSAARRSAQTDMHIVPNGQHT